jgi:flagellin
MFFVQLRIAAIAMGQKSRIASYVSIAEGISRARGIIDVTLASGSAIAETLKQMKVAAGAARSEDLTADQRLALQSDYDALRSQIDRIASSAQFNGSNLPPRVALNSTSLSRTRRQRVWCS